jgi:hypothetical protein
MNKQSQLEDLVKIRSIMERSSRFLSLSGLSGVFAGIYALTGAYLVHSWLQSNRLKGNESIYAGGMFSEYSFIFFIAAAVLILSIVTGLVFSYRKAQKTGDKFWNSASKRLAINLFIPLITGAIFCLNLLKNGATGMIAPSMLIFYGLALLNGSKYTLDDIRQLAICEIVLGIAALFLTGYGLYFWAIGFGILHIIYGIVVYYKYDA